MTTTKNQTHILHDSQKLKGTKTKMLNSETIKVLEENMGKEILNIGLSNNFTKITAKVKSIKEIKWVYIKLKRFSIGKEKKIA